MLDRFGLTPLLARLLTPPLRLMEIGSTATLMTVSGSLRGISYGGALILKEVRSGKVLEPMVRRPSLRTVEKFLFGKSATENSSSQPAKQPLTRKESRYASQ